MLTRLALLFLARSASAVTVHMVCTDEANNDVLKVATSTPALPDGLNFAVYPSIDKALNKCVKGDGFMLFADSMRSSNPSGPQKNTTVVVTEAQQAQIDRLELVVYVEFPQTLPQSPGMPLEFRQTLWERAVVTAKDLDPATLAPMQLLHPHKYVDFVVLPHEMATISDIVIAKVAGYNR